MLLVKFYLAGPISVAKVTKFKTTLLVYEISQGSLRLTGEEVGIKLSNNVVILRGPTMVAMATNVGTK